MGQQHSLAPYARAPRRHLRDRIAIAARAPLRPDGLVSDVLIDPDESAIERAREVNARLHEGMPQGWWLVDTHQPHVTTLQRYVRSSDLEGVYDAVAPVVNKTDMAALSYHAVSTRTMTVAFLIMARPCFKCR